MICSPWETYQGCKESIEVPRETLIRLGFKVPPDKSVFKPVQDITFLGYVLNSVDMTVRPTDEKVTKMGEAIEHLEKQERCTTRERAGLIWLMVEWTIPKWWNTEKAIIVSWKKKRLRA